MTHWLSEPVEALLARQGFPFSDTNAQQQFEISTDVLIVGSGYGAALAALGLLESRQSLARPAVWVFEAGREYLPDDFPKTMSELPGYVGVNAINNSALWDIRAGTGAVTISARGLGGTSLVNASVAVRPDAQVLASWPGNTQTDWHSRLSLVYGKIERLLGVNFNPLAAENGSYRALAASAAALGSQINPAPLTISFQGPTAHSADHEPCNHCGNCVMGCHSGAKGSLNMNAWPLARQLGAELFTGIRVQSLQRLDDGHWLIECVPAAGSKHRVRVRAATVILGAGTLGSTEILKRSVERKGLCVSSTLGQQFSLNGDALVSVTGQRQRVNMLASVPGEMPPRTQPGPTISGLAAIALKPQQTTGAQMPEYKRIFQLEDAQVPFALHQVWQEMIVTQSLLSRFADGRQSAWHQLNTAHDPLAISGDLAEHTQTLLVMGHDNASGELRWHDGELKPVWNRVKGDYYDQLHATLLDQQTLAFDGGLFSPNLISQPLPTGFAGIIEGADDLQGNLLSVHPLGGCCLAQSVADGVVNLRGQVFSNAKNDPHAVYENLYVLDGSIIPCAIGTNPMLTIAGLSYVLASEISLPVLNPRYLPLADLQHAAVDAARFPELTQYRTIPAGVRWPVPDPDSRKVEARFNERLVCHLRNPARSLLPWSKDQHITLNALKALLPYSTIPPLTKALVLDVSIDFQGEQSLDRWISHPQQALPASAVLSADITGGVFTTPDNGLQALMHLQGQVNLGVTDQHVPGRLVRWRRTTGAVFRFLRYRRMDMLVGLLPATVQRLLLSDMSWQIRKDALARRTDKTVRQRVRDFLRIAALQSQARYLRYEFSSDQGLTLRGEKTLVYSIGARDLLAALMVLPVSADTRSGVSRKLHFEIDAVRVSNGPSALQITSSPDTPTSVMAAGGVATYFLRVIMNTHFWSFAAPAYQQFAQRNNIENAPKQGRFSTPPTFIFYGAGGKKQSLAREKFEQSNGHSGSPSPLSRLIRYQPADNRTDDRQTLLLVHGLAHSSRVFWTDTIACNFVQYFLAQNYDVWILDHRASANYIHHINPDDRWDDIALIDVPWAVKTIFNQINQLSVPGQERQIHVFSHCIGAGAVAMAVLAGKLDYEQRMPDGSFVSRSMLASLVPHAVTPWLHASAENRARANVWAWFKEFEPIQTIEPLPHHNPGFLETVYDRLAALAMSAEERRQWSSLRGFGDWRGPGFAQSIYTRYTLFWGRQWFNKNLTRATRHEFSGMIGPVPIGVMQQVYFSMTRGLLSDHEGANSYVRDSAFARHWTFPTLFLHGNRNTVFDQESSRQSADQLTRLRRLHTTGKVCEQELLPEDYASQKVWIEILNDYGHMDVIFGKRASLEVFPRLHDFFSTAARDDTLHRYAQRRLSSLAARDWFMDNCRTRSAPKSGHTSVTAPKTGPIISSPRRHADGQVSVRVWLEAEDFLVYPAKGINVSSPLGDVVATHRPYVEQPSQERLAVNTDRATKPDRSDEYGLWREEFWLHDVVFPRTSTGQFRFEMDYGSAVAVDPGTVIAGNSVDWSQMAWFQRACSDAPSDAAPEQADKPMPLSLLAGSCVYPGLPFDRHGSFSAFNAMRAHLHDNPTTALRGVDGLVLLGDQIYADATADFFDPKSHYERYRNAYRLAFSDPDVAFVMSHLPTWLVIDDHEFKDNWRGEYDKTLCYARSMAGLYQMHQHNHWDAERADLWYDFTCAGYPAFVFDTRSDSHAADRPAEDVLGPQQLKAFEQWLISQGAQPLILLCSGSAIGPVDRQRVLFPDLLRDDDGLLAYPGFLRKVAALILRYAPQSRVLWLTGDPHLSCVVELCATLAQGQVRITQICCSGLNAPLPFANAQAAAFDWDSSFRLLLNDSGGDIELSGRQHLLTDNPRHFVRLDVDDGYQLTVQAYAGNGAAAGEVYRTTLTSSHP